MATSLTVTRIAHACQLIELGDLRILTDAWFTETASYHQGEPIASDSWMPEQGSDGSVIVGPDVPEGHTVLLAMSTYPGGEGGLSFTAPVQDPAPSCLLDPRYDPAMGGSLAN